MAAPAATFTIARVRTVAFLGLDVAEVDVEVQLASGLPSFTIVGLPDKAVAESRERARGRTSVDGGLRTSGRWTGNFRLRVKIRKNGRVIATCRTGRVGWRASPR